MDLEQLPDGIRRKGSPEAGFDRRLRGLPNSEDLGRPVSAVSKGDRLEGTRGDESEPARG